MAPVYNLCATNESGLVVLVKTNYVSFSCVRRSGGIHRNSSSITGQPYEKTYSKVDFYFFRRGKHLTFMHEKGGSGIFYLSHLGKVVSTFNLTRTRAMGPFSLHFTSRGSHWFENNGLHRVCPLCLHWGYHEQDKKIKMQ